MLSPFHRRLPRSCHSLAVTSREKEMPSRQIAATDEAIDRLVYKLYELREEEIRIVKGKSSHAWDDPEAKK